MCLRYMPFQGLVCSKRGIMASLLGAREAQSVAGLVSAAPLVTGKAGCGVGARDEATEVRMAAESGAEELEFGWRRV